MSCYGANCGIVCHRLIGVVFNFCVTCSKFEFLDSDRSEPDGSSAQINQQNRSVYVVFNIFLE